MNRTLKFSAILSTVALITGCKLAVIVPEGGEVQSLGSGTCSAGTICSVEVPDTNFDEVFTAVPNDGWYFHKWNQGDRFFCGNSPIPECTLTFQGQQRGENIEALVASAEVFYLMPVFKDYPRATLVDGKSRVIQVDGREWEWLQPADFIDYSYNQVAAVCPNGICSGTLPGSTIDLTGYTWASSDDVRFLFQAYEESGKEIREDFDKTFEGPLDGQYALIALLSDETTAVILQEDDDETRSIDTELLQGKDEAGIGGAWFWHPLD